MKNTNPLLALVGALLLILAVGLALYGQTLGFGYVWDDISIFVDRVALLNDPLSWEMLSERVLPSTSYYRPLIFLTFWIEFHLFGQNPVVSHVINLAIFLLNALLVFAIARQLVRKTGRQALILIPLCAALLYVVHPALIETTAWMSGRFDQMVTLFILLATCVYLTRWPQLAKNIAIAVLMMASLLCKELGVVLPVVLCCVWLATEARPDSESVGQTLIRGLRCNALLLGVLVLTFVGYWLLRTHYLPNTFHGNFTWDYVKTAWFDQMLPLEALRFYLHQTFLPFRDVAVLHPVDGSPNLLGDILIVVLLATILAYAVVRRTTAPWLFLAGMVCLVPVLHLFPLDIAGNIGHERFMTTEMAFVALAAALVRYDRILAAGVARGWLHPGRLLLFKRLIGVGAVVWLLAGVITVITVVPFWQNDLTLWGWMRQRYPDMTYVRYNFWLGANKAGRQDLEAKELERARRESETTGIDIELQLLYADALIKKGNPDGLAYDKGILAGLPPLHLIAQSRERLNPVMKAFSVRLSVVQIAALYTDLALGTLAFEGDVSQAMAYQKIARWYEPRESVPAMMLRKQLLLAAGRFAEAEEVQRAVEKMYYNNWEGAKRAESVLLARFCVTRDMQPPCSELMQQGYFDQERYLAGWLNSMKYAAKINIEKLEEALPALQQREFSHE